MSETQSLKTPQNETVAVTLQLEPGVYEFFLEKAQKADVGIEPYLASTLSIVLGCKAFNKMSVCSPQPVEDSK
jgi:hypothetical protein